MMLYFAFVFFNILSDCLNFFQITFFNFLLQLFDELRVDLREVIDKVQRILDLMGNAGGNTAMIRESENWSPGWEASIRRTSERRRH